MADVRWGLEYAFLFGVPGNKIETGNGRSRWAFPFLDRAEAEAHFYEWQRTFERWKGIETQEVRKSKKRWRAKIGRISMTLHPQPIEFYFPMAPKPLIALYNLFWYPPAWNGPWPDWNAGLLALLAHQDVQMGLWSIFDRLAKHQGGISAGRVDIALTETSAVSPDQFYYRKSRDECMIEGEYFRGVPDLIAEVYSPASWHIDRGARQEVYRRARVPHVWLLDPLEETVEVLELTGKRLESKGIFGRGATFTTAVFPGETIRIDEFFERRQRVRDWEAAPRTDPKPMPSWVVPRKTDLGLEYFFLLGHPEHRWEIWGNRAPSILPFGSEEEAKHRLGQFIADACRWEGTAVVKPAALGPDVDQAEVGRFRLMRSGRHIQLDVSVDARKFQELLRVCASRKAWDWGERSAER